MPFHYHLYFSRTRGLCCAVPFAALLAHEFIRLKRKKSFWTLFHVAPTQKAHGLALLLGLSVTVQPVYITICLAP